MAKFRLIIKPRSPFQTPLHSDTLFGHICWALRYLKGEDELSKFLKTFDDKNAPLLLSSGFPKDYLPMPLLKPLLPDEEEKLCKLYKDGKQSRLEFARDMKRFRKLSYVQMSAIQMLKDKLSYYNLYAKHLCGEVLLEDPEVSMLAEIWHNAKNRLTDRVIEGKLFAKEDTFYSEGTELNVYTEDSYFGREAFCEIFDFIGRSGYGADKSVGRGVFDYNLVDGWNLAEADNPNAFMTLSHYHPSNNEFRDGFYEISTKFGKIGGHWASGIDGGPFKMPLIMLNPGSVFLCDNQRSFYGGLVNNIHKRQEIVQYGIALPLRVRILYEA